MELLDLLDTEVLVMSSSNLSQSDKPIIKDGYVSDPKLSAKFFIESPYFAEWLKNNDKFKYVPSNSTAKSFTCYKDRKGYWSAQKRVQGKLRAKRLGDSLTLSHYTVAAFWDVAVFLTSDYQTKDDEIQTLQKEVRELSGKLAELTDKLRDMETRQTEDQQSVTKCNKPKEVDQELLKLLETALRVPVNNASKAKPSLFKAIELLTGETKQEVSKRLKVGYNKRCTGQ